MGPPHWSRMKTTTFTVNAIGDPEPVITSVDCTRVEIGEDGSVPNWPTTDYEVKGTELLSDWIVCPAGTKFEFLRRANQPGFRAGSIVGYVQTAAGATTFQQIED